MAFVPKTGVASGRDNGVIDIYRGKGIIKAGGWRQAFISPGFVTLAGNLEPNDPFTLIPEAVLTDGRYGKITGMDPRGCPFVLIGALVDSETAQLAEYVRFGRIAQIRDYWVVCGPAIWLQCPYRDEIFADEDDLEVAA